MVTVMKIKRFAIERVPVVIEYTRPIAGRLLLLFNYYRLVKFIKFQPTINNVPACKHFYRLYVPKLEKEVDAL